MQSKKWRQFDELTEKCYSNMIGMEKDGSCWQQAFELLKEIVREERQKASALGALGRKQEAAEYCRKWIRKELENICILRSPADFDAFQSGRCAEHNGCPESLVVMD